jgi:hypothetical protein
MTQPVLAPGPTAGVDHARARLLQPTGVRRDRCRPSPGLGPPVGYPALIVAVAHAPVDCDTVADGGDTRRTAGHRIGRVNQDDRRREFRAQQHLQPSGQPLPGRTGRCRQPDHDVTSARPRPPPKHGGRPPCRDDYKYRPSW